MRRWWLALVLLVAPFACDAGSPKIVDPACDPPKRAPSRGACFTGHGCNPVTAEPCNGLSCSWIEGTEFECVASSAYCILNPDVVWCFEQTDYVDVCSACANDSSIGPFCAPTLACLESGGCARYCCGDDDCGTGSCDDSGTPGGVGICVRSDDAGEGA